MESIQTVAGLRSLCASNSRVPGAGLIAHRGQTTVTDRLPHPTQLPFSGRRTVTNLAFSEQDPFPLSGGFDCLEVGVLMAIHFLSVRRLWRIWAASRTISEWALRSRGKKTRCVLKKIPLPPLTQIVFLPAVGMLHSSPLDKNVAKPAPGRVRE